MKWDYVTVQRVFFGPSFSGMYAGIKFFIIDFIFKRCPKLRQRYDTPYIIWTNLPTDLQLKERSNTLMSRRVSTKPRQSIELMELSIINKPGGAKQISSRTSSERLLAEILKCYKGVITRYYWSQLVASGLPGFISLSFSLSALWVWTGRILVCVVCIYSHSIEASGMRAVVRAVHQSAFSLEKLRFPFWSDWQWMPPFSF